MADGIESVADKLVPAPTLTIGPSIPGEQFATALAALFKLTDDLFTTLNSPAMLAARQRQDVQAALLRMDADLAHARKTGDLAQIDKESSG